MGEIFCKNMCGNLTDREGHDQCDMCEEFDKQLVIDEMK